MAIGNSSVGLLFQIKAEDDSEKVVRKARQNIEKETGAIAEAGEKDFKRFADAAGVSEGAFSKLAGGIGAGIAGIAAISAGIAAAGAALFNLARTAAEAGTEVYNFSKLTGLSAESISTIKLASEQAGTSLEEFEEVWESFIEVLIEGGQGAEDAAAKLKKAGIDPQQGFKDLEGSVRKAFDAIQNAKSQAEASAIAMAVFGESGLNMVKVAREMEGGFDSFKKKLEELGLTMDRDAIEKSKEFDKDLKTLETTAKALAYSFAREWMPQIASSMRDVSKFFSENQSIIKSWGQSLADAILGIKAVVREVYAFQQSPVGQWITKAIEIGMSTTIPGMLAYIGRNERPIAEGGASAELGSANAAQATLTPDPKKAEEARKKELAARAEMNRATLANVSQTFKALQDMEKGHFEEGLKGAALYLEERLDGERAYTQRLKQLATDAADLDIAQGKDEKARREALKAELAQIETDSGNRIKQIRRDIETQTSKETKEEFDKAVKERQADIQKAISYWEAEYKKFGNARTSELRRLEVDFEKGILTEEQYLNRLRIEHAAFLDYRKRNLEEQLKAVRGNAEAERDLRKQVEEAKAEIEENAHKNRIEDLKRRNEEIRMIRQGQGGEDGVTWSGGKISPIFGRPGEERDGEGRSIESTDQPSWSESFLGPFKEMFNDENLGLIDTMGQAFQNLGGMAVNAFNGMAQAIGGVIQQWVLYGKTGPAIMKQILASALATIAAEAAVQAIFELAKGFAALFLNPAAAAAHFKAAALFGAVAAGSAVAGRAIAGNSFASQTAGNAISGGAGSGSGSGQRQTQIVEEDRFRSQDAGARRRSLTGKLDIVELRVPQGMMDQGIIKAINDRTEGGEAILRLVEA